MPIKKNPLKQEHKKQLPFIDLDTVIPTNLSDTVYQKIRHLCNVINTVEWSGAIFYEIHGILGKPSEMSITVHDLIPLDKGTTGFTSYEFDERIINYGFEKGYLEKDYKIGHIHSHHSMATFFSSTDNEEVNENSEFQNPYLSIIVNNKGDYSAKIAFRGEAVSETISFMYQDVDNTVRKKKITRQQHVVMTYPCKCINPESQDKQFLSQIKEICKPKVTKVAYATNSFTYQPSMLIDSFDDQFGLDDPLDFAEDNLVDDFFPFVLMNGAIGVSHDLTANRAIAVIYKMIENQDLELKSYIEEIYNRFPDLVAEFYGVEEDVNDIASNIYDEMLEALEGNLFSKQLIPIIDEFKKYQK